MSTSALYIVFAAVFLFGSAAYHFFAAAEYIERVLGKGKNIRIIGLFLLLFGMVGFLVKDKGTQIVAFVLFLSGAWRLFLPRSSIAFQQKSYPRWVHGIIIMTVGILFLLLTIPTIKQWLGPW